MLRSSHWPRGSSRHEIAGRLRGLDTDAELAVYRVTQEPLTNAARHASASIVELSLAQSNVAVRLSMCDDGAGISADRLHDGGGGLAGMRERALLIGASLHVGLRQEGGTEVVLEVPA